MKEKNDDDSDNGSMKSLSKGISLYRADSSMNSSSSTMRGTRWSFGQKIEDDGRTHFINIPCDNIKQKFRVLELIQAGSYGDNLRCQLWYSDKANNT